MIEWLLIRCGKDQRGRYIDEVFGMRKLVEKACEKDTKLLMTLMNLET